MGETNAKLTPETVLSIDICRLQKSVKLSTFECRKHKKIGEEGWGEEKTQCSRTKITPLTFKDSTKLLQHLG